MFMKPKVAFICVHNSCRSQIAEALGTLFASDTFESYSAGTEQVPFINPDAIKTVLEVYQYDMTNQYSKTLDKIPDVDIVITMGCNVTCPFLPCRYREDWGIEDPTGKSAIDFIDTANIIYKKILDLKFRIETGIIT
ncbi:MAG: arsenate reductase ArsC [Veillonella sp.]|nr:arsenate reductase ArsC [Veillonella sp.]MBP6923687.1 arsenate reductase ArsC [Veillonella sp.]MBP8616705.1 arsenate reductase ArsC [Veillonella sp.]MBP9550988.1 arsenate reductase ArsC [Veillonella sp.]